MLEKIIVTGIRVIFWISVILYFVFLFKDLQENRNIKDENTELKIKNARLEEKVKELDDRQAELTKKIAENNKIGG